jgi:hypothetical protein
MGRARNAAVGTIVLLGSALLPCPSLAQKPGASRLGSAGTTTGAPLIVVTPGMTLQQVLGNPDAAKVRLLDGKTTTVGDLRRDALARAKREADLKSGQLAPTDKQSVRMAKSRAGLLARLGAAQAGEAWSRTGRAVTAQQTSAFDEGVHTAKGPRGDRTISPGETLRITGFALGQTMGQVNLFGCFPSTSLALAVLGWRDTEIQAVVPKDVRGVPDCAVSVQVVTRAGRTHRLDGGWFLAAREEITVTDHLTRLARIRPAASWTAALNDDGRVSRVTVGEVSACPGVGSDVLTATDPGRGFVITKIFLQKIGRTDSGDGCGTYEDCPGSRVFTPGYELGDWQGDDIPIRWGLWRSHESPYLGMRGLDQCVSFYQVGFNLSGPAGVSPF